MKNYKKSIDEIIGQAMEKGQFDDLPGKGRPLDLSTNPHEDPAWRLAFQALRSSGYTLPWIEKRQQIESDLEAAKTNLERAWNWRHDALANSETRSFVNREWQRALEQFRQKVVEINQKIFDYNLEVPAGQFQCRKIDVDKEIEHIISPVD